MSLEQQAEATGGASLKRELTSLLIPLLKKGRTGLKIYAPPAENPARAPNPLI
jgi:hypothetical protein